MTTPRLSGTMGRAPVKTLLSDHFLPAWVGEGGGVSNSSLKRCHHASMCSARTRRSLQPSPSFSLESGECTIRAVSSMLDALPTDALAHVCAHCDFEATERCMRTCRALRKVATDDGFFRLVADIQWGGQFWREALARPTPKRFQGMRIELARIDAFQCMLRSYGLDEWTASHFRSFWKYEAHTR